MDYSECGWEIWWWAEGTSWVVERRRWNGRWEFRKLKVC